LGAAVRASADFAAYSASRAFIFVSSACSAAAFAFASAGSVVSWSTLAACCGSAGWRR
jgi:hypothetical protein